MSHPNVHTDGQQHSKAEESALGRLSTERPHVQRVKISGTESVDRQLCQVSPVSTLSYYCNQSFVNMLRYSDSFRLKCTD